MFPRHGAPAACRKKPHPVAQNPCDDRESTAAHDYAISRDEATQSVNYVCAEVEDNRRPAHVKNSGPLWVAELPAGLFFGAVLWSFGVQTSSDLRSACAGRGHDKSNYINRCQDVCGARGYQGLVLNGMAVYFYTKPSVQAT